jgi:hypothetical protein
VRLFIFAQNTFHLCSKHFSSLLKTLFIFAGQKRTFYLFALLTFATLTKRLFAFWQLTSQPLLIFFEIYTPQKVKTLARESYVWGGKKRNLHAKISAAHNTIAIVLLTIFENKYTIPYCNSFRERHNNN